MRKSLFDGYPHDGKVKSEEVFPNRIPTRIVEEKVMIHINPEFYPQWNDEMTPVDKIDFLLNRIHDYSVALGIAEQQVRDMNAEYPFLPQDFGFVESDDKLPGEGFQPQCYRKGKYLMARMDDNFWYISGIGRVGISNSSIAFTVLRALEIISDEEFKDNIFVTSSNELTDDMITEANEAHIKQMEAYKEGFHNGQKAKIEPIAMDEPAIETEASDGTN